MRIHRNRSRFSCLAALTALGLGTAVCSMPASAASQRPPTMIAVAPMADGVIRLRSGHDVPETVKRIRAAVEAKGIRFFDAIDQSELAKGANLVTAKSTLVLFGNPPLGVQFLQANRYAGLDWPVRMLVVEEADGSVWIAWSDFQWIGRRYVMKNRAAQLKMASEVAAAIASEAAS